MRWMLLAACVAVSACGNMPDVAAGNARRICAENGHQPGSAAFNACFDNAFRAMYPGAPRS